MNIEEKQKAFEDDLKKLIQKYMKNEDDSKFCIQSSSLLIFEGIAQIRMRTNSTNEYFKKTTKSLIDDLLESLLSPSKMLTKKQKEKHASNTM